MSFRETSLFFGIVGLLTVCANGMEMSPVVTTSTGTMRGHLVTVQEGNEDVYEFSAIPFAEAPIGERRFKKPVPIQYWNDELQAINLPPECPQGAPTDARKRFMQDVGMSEDCLFLNIWTPKSALESKKNIPVFFWIHGGAFFEGSTTMTKFNGSVMSSFQNVIFVSVQYRLGPLGFAYLGVEDVPGNMGLWDQLLALKWVSQNAASFGGDGDKITIAGQSAGAASASHHLLSPHSRPYIHQAIMESGSATALWAFKGAEQAMINTNKIVEYFSKHFPEECANASTVQDSVYCLQNADFNYTTKLQTLLQEVDLDKLSIGLVDTISLPPVIDGDFLPRDPIQMIAEGDFKNVPILLGTTKDEGTFTMQMTGMGLRYLPSKERPNKPIGWFNMTTYQDFVASYFVFYPRNGLHIEPVIKSAIEQQYWRTPDDKLSQLPLTGQAVLDQLIAMVSDASFICPVTTLSDTNAQLSTSPVYKYLFNHKTIDDNGDPEWKGVRHGAEQQYTMGDAVNVNIPRVSYTDQEKLLSRRLLQYWTNFVKTGDPNSMDDSLSNQLELPNWPRNYASGATIVLDGDASEGKVLTAYKERDCLFWNRKMIELNARLRGEMAPGLTTTMPTCVDPHVARSRATTSKGSAGVAAVFLSLVFAVSMF